jgi:KaiC/GvpD/RAD55 family RecA-like ATPase
MVSRLLTTDGKPASFEGLLDLIAALDGRRRSVVVIAGAPGAGKLALAERLVFRRKRRGPPLSCGWTVTTMTTAF